MLGDGMSLWKARQGARHLTAETLWRMPSSFGIARLFGPSYVLRCVVFHNITARPSPFTKGMWVDTALEQFEAKLKFLSQHYTPVSLGDVLADADGLALPPRAILVTFDDAYASVAEIAAPLCAKYRVPAVFFVNGAFLDNRQLAPDNLVCYVANEMGMTPFQEAARAVRGDRLPALDSMDQVFSVLFPMLSLVERQAFLDALARGAQVDPGRLAAEEKLYVTREQLAGLAGHDFEIGNHTHTHVHCRCLTAEQVNDEVGGNKMELESLTGRPVRSFSLPYGSSADFTPELERHLRRAGYKAVFFSESVANGRHADHFHLDRVSTQAASDDTFFFEMEVMPRLRAVRNRFFHSVAPVSESVKCTS
jgi:peptidoglycan/xylan/chitin deacetylase (PgdA/CDA1 family)